MREMNADDRREMEYQITEIMRSSVSKEYATGILMQYDGCTEHTFMEDVIENVLETSAWEEEGVYSDSDIRYAIGRELWARLGIDE